MKKNIIKGLTLMGALMFTATSFAQETPAAAEETTEESKPVFSGNLDMYFKYDASGHGVGNSYTSFTGSQGAIELGMATIKAEHNIGKVGAVIDLGFGNRAEEFAANSANTRLAIKQAYLTYDIADDITLTGGTFGTHIGYELLDASDNRNYSMSYAFSAGPFLSTGLKADYALNDELSVMLGVTLPTNYRTGSAAATSQKAIIGQIAYSKDETSVAFNFSTESSNPAPTNTTQFDIVLDHEFSDKFALGFNGTYQLLANDFGGSESWYSTVVYLKYQAKKDINLTYRGEYFDGTTGNVITFSTPGTSVISNTLSANYTINNLTIIPEVRGDLASENVFTGNKVNVYALVGAAYSF